VTSLELLHWAAASSSAPDPSPLSLLELYRSSSMPSPWTTGTCCSAPPCASLLDLSRRRINRIGGLDNASAAVFPTRGARVAA
jgi:hypothetical protein